MNSSFFLMLRVLLVSCVTCAGAEIPFQFRDGLVWVKVTSAKGPLNFILDSGASQSVIDRETAKQIGLNFGSTQSVSGVNGRATAQWASGFEAECGGVGLNKSLLAIDLSKPSSRCGTKIAGLLGADFFRGRIVQIDFHSKRVRILGEAAASSRGAVLPVRTPNGVPCIPVSVNGGEPEWVRLDTGSNGALEAVENGSRSGGSLRTTIGLAASSADSSQGRTRIRIGPLELVGVHIAWHHAAIFPGEDGLLGTQVLSRFKVTLDGVHHRAVLE